MLLFAWLERLRILFFFLPKAPRLVRASPGIGVFGKENISCPPAVCGKAQVMCVGFVSQITTFTGGPRFCQGMGVCIKDHYLLFWT